MRAFVLIAALAVSTAGAAVAGAQTTYRARIPHRDASGRGTIVEIDPGVPGARAFVHDEERPVPARGELSLPPPTPRATPTAAAPPSPAR